MVGEPGLRVQKFVQRTAGPFVPINNEIPPLRPEMHGAAAGMTRSAGVSRLPDVNPMAGTAIEVRL